MRPRRLPAVALVLACGLCALVLASPVAGQKQDAPADELWREYPLSPAAGQKAGRPQPPAAPSAPPRNEASQPGASEEPERGLAPAARNSDVRDFLVGFVVTTALLLVAVGLLFALGVVDRPLALAGFGGAARGARGERREAEERKPRDAEQRERQRREGEGREREQRDAERREHERVKADAERRGRERAEAEPRKEQQPVRALALWLQAAARVRPQAETAANEASSAETGAVRPPNAVPATPSPTHSVEADDAPRRREEPSQLPATEAGEAERDGREEPAADVAWETCEIRWRGLVGGGFSAHANPPDGAAFEAARSPMFEWREVPPQTEDAIAAHAALVDELVASGWEPVGHGEEWYEQRFRRPHPADSGTRHSA